jgi:hypothetical protein
MAFCVNCGTKIEEGSKFCIKCGKAINITPEPQVIVQQQVQQPEQSSENNQIIKKGLLSYNKSLVKTLKGTATIYKNRLEWEGESGMKIVINFSEMLKTEVSNIKQTLAIFLTNAQKYSFSKTLTAGDIAKQVAFGYLGSGNIISELAAWQSAINVARGIL